MSKSHQGSARTLFCVVIKKGKKEFCRHMIPADCSMDAYRWGEIQLKHFGFEGSVELVSDAIAKEAEHEGV